MNTCMIRLTFYPPCTLLALNPRRPQFSAWKAKLCIDTKNIFFSLLLLATNRIQQQQQQQQKRAIYAIHKLDRKKLENSSLEFLFVSIWFKVATFWWTLVVSSIIIKNKVKYRIISSLRFSMKRTNEEQKKTTVCNLVYLFRQLIDKKIPIKFPGWIEPGVTHTHTGSGVAVRSQWFVLTEFQFVLYLLNKVSISFSS